MRHDNEDIVVNWEVVADMAFAMDQALKTLERLSYMGVGDFKPKVRDDLINSIKKAEDIISDDISNDA